MIERLKKLLGFGPSVDLGQLVRQGAQIVDVRTRPEFSSGHIRGSINIPLQDLAGSLKRIKKEKPVILCCATGMRSSSAKNILKSKGFSQVYNGGGWQRLQNKIL